VLANQLVHLVQGNVPVTSATPEMATAVREARVIANRALGKAIFGF
jgi:hypothetical protein